MKIVNVSEIEGTEFPAGRRTRVVVGENGALQGRYFSQGYVVIYPKGSVPAHDHVMEETYFIISGRGEILVGTETRAVKKGDLVLVPSGESHSLHNLGEENMEMMFVYAPSMIADHWDAELKGELV